MTATQLVPFNDDSNDDDIDKEKLLDNFPLSEWELDRLLDFYNACILLSKDGDEKELLLSQICQHVVVENDQKNNTCIDEKEGTIPPPPTTTTTSTANWLSSIQFMEKNDMLPMMMMMMTSSSSSVREWFCQQTPQLVSPLLPYYITPESNRIMYQAFYYLEAMVSLLGRRGTRCLQNIVYDVISSNAGGGGGADIGIEQQQQQPSSSSPEEDVVVHVVEAKALIDFVYRHLRAALYLQETSSTKQHQRKQKPVKNCMLQTPKSWIISLQQTAAKASTCSNTTTTTNNNNKTNNIHIPRSVWNEWINTTLPESMRGIATFYHCILFSPDHSNIGPTSLPPLSLPQLQSMDDDDDNSSSSSSNYWNHTSDLLPLSLGCISSVFGGNWYRVYSSNHDGLSFLTFHNSLLKYVGPTVMLIRRKEGNNNNHQGVFGFYTECPWKDSNTWYGGGGGGEEGGYDSFLFKVDRRDLKVYYPTDDATTNGSYHMYLNAESSFNGIGNSNNNPLRGLAIGGISKDTPRVHLTLSLEGCQATSTDTTYAPGPLVDPDDANDGDASDNNIVSPYFDVDEIEVWAVNVATKTEYLNNVREGEKRVSRKETARQRAAHVDRSQFLDDFKTGTILNKLFDHREEARGRHDFVASSKRGSGYFVESKPPSKRLLRNESSGDISFDEDDSISDFEDDKKVDPDAF